MTEPQPSVPKFGSFRPKFTLPDRPQNQDQIEKEKVKSHHHDRDDDTKAQLTHRKGPHSKDRRRGSSKDRNSFARYKELETSKPLPSPIDDSNETFIIDRKGDLKNIVYGSIHRYDIPPFHRHGAGSILGIPSYLRIDRDYGDEKGIVLTDRRVFKNSHREKYVFSKIEKQRTRLLKIRPGIVIHGSFERDYVPFQTSQGRKRKRNSSSSSSEDGEMNYRSIHGKAKIRDEPEDENLQYATESEYSGPENGRGAELDTEAAAVRQKTINLSRRVEKSPHDITSWLELIKHQDIILGGDQRRVTNAELKSIADIKIHMYEQALGNFQSVEDREILLQGLMVEGAKIWELKAQSEKWEQISKDNINSLVLWQSYLNFRQATFGTFQYEEMRDIYLQRIKLLLHTLNLNNDNSLYEQIIYIFLRLTTFILDSGYAELAVALWQGILELNFFAPPKPMDTTEKIALFKEFWESEVPRVGEDTALGWCHSAENNGISDMPDPMSDEVDNKLDDRQIFKSWAAAEQLRAQGSRMPARTMDDVVEDDPFRVILASDIEEFLVSFPVESDELRTSLLDAFLLFCRLPALSSTNSASMSWSFDPFIGESLLECNTPWIDAQYARGDATSSGERQIDISSIFKVPLSNFQTSPDSMFSNSWFKSMKAWRDMYGEDTGPLRLNFIRNALKRLLCAYPKEHLVEYYLAFEWRNEPDSIKKICKNILKQHPSSLRLYNAYAMIEWSRGNRDLADSVYLAALNMAKSMPENDRDSSILLWKAWIWTCLETRGKSTALSRLLSIQAGIPSDELSPTPTQLLKTKQYLYQRRDYHLYSGSVSYALLFAECLVLLEYLTATPIQSDTQSSTQGIIAAALIEHMSFSRTLQQTFKDRGIPGTSSHELFLQSAAHLLYHHASTGPFRPALLREYLTNYLTLFPRNSIFLSLYAFNELRLRVDNRVRNILSSTVLTPAHDTLTSRLFAIYFEITHGTIHSVRAAFEHAVDSPSRYSPGLWRFYLLYTLRTPQFRKHSKDVWYRALRACPWAKQLYITGFENLADMERAELMGTWKVMGEKGLRVHVDLEEAMEVDR